MKNLKTFKTEIFIYTVQNSYQDEKFNDLVDKIEYLITKKREIGNTPSYLLFINMANLMTEIKLTIELIKELKKEKIENLDFDIYLNHFLKQIEKAKKLLLKLRPFVLEYIKDWDKKRKDKDLNNPNLSIYLKGWFK